jgi:hypothetical protein
MIVEDQDTLSAPDLSLVAPKKLVVLHGGHFDAYVRGPALAARAPSDWYNEHLLSKKKGIPSAA